MGVILLPSMLQWLIDWTFDNAVSADISAVPDITSPLSQFPEAHPMIFYPRANQPQCGLLRVFLETMHIQPSKGWSLEIILFNDAAVVLYQY